MHDGAAAAGDGAAGAVAGNKGVDLAAGLADDFLAGGFFVIEGIEGIFELPRQEVASIDIPAIAFFLFQTGHVGDGGLRRVPTGVLDDAVECFVDVMGHA